MTVKFYNELLKYRHLAMQSVSVFNSNIPLPVFKFTELILVGVHTQNFVHSETT